MKKFLTKLFLMVIPIVCVTLYFAIIIEPRRNGDLGQIGFIPFDDKYHDYIKSMALDSIYDTEINNLQFEQANCDSSILIIGDSFSEQRIYGYTNHLAMLYPGFKVYNLILNEDTNIKFQLFINRLLWNKPLPRIIILESAERHLSDNLSSLTTYPQPTIENVLIQSSNKAKHCKTKSTKKDKLDNFVKNLVERKESIKKTFLYTQEFIKRKLNVTDNPVKHVKLRKKLFSCKGKEKDLFFYYEDIKKGNEEKHKKAKQLLEFILSTTEQKGFNFLFVVPADKFDLYKDFTKNNPYKKSKCQLDYYKEFNDDQRFLNCKELLYPHVKNGEKDIYKCHDTHWSPLAARYVAEEIKRRIDNQRNHKIIK